MCKDVRVQAAKEAALRRLLLAVSRELREPANGVLAAAALLARRESVAQDPEASFCARALGASCRLLLGIVQNVLCMRRVETGELEVSAEAFDPAAAADDVLQVCRLSSAGAATVTLRAAPLPRAVVGDASVFTQGLQNLVTNALRFEAGRGVRVWLRCEAVAASEDATHALLATVADQGRGLTAEEVETVFRAYAAAPSERGGGTGLGLFVAREYARRAGGDVTVVSEPGKGAAFTLRLPVRVTAADAEDWAQRVAAAGAALPAPQSAAGRPRSPSPPPRSSVAPDGLSTPPPKRQHSAAGRRLRVLLAEDHELNRLLVQRLLSQAGFDVRTAVDGADALQQLRAGATSFHLALLDMAMPELSGPEAARAFRAWEAERSTPSASRLPIVALTANVLEQHAAECAAAGMDAFLTKPLRAGALAQLRDMAADYAARTSAQSGGFLD
jgi:CheY-like chemotaxis protein/anti-sigma regulatory factor (Ser/Thr protein kinase)